MLLGRSCGLFQGGLKVMINTARGRICAKSRLHSFQVYRWGMTRYAAAAMAGLQCARPWRPHHRDAINAGRVVMVFAVVVLAGIAKPVGGDPVTDKAVMASFKAGITSINRMPGRWSGSNPCVWHGVSCDGSENVLAINISTLGLTGTVTPQLHKLASLTSLELWDNSFTGAMPTLQGMASLHTTYLAGNDFDFLPADFFDGLTSIRELGIASNPNLNASSGGWTFPSSMTDAAATLQELYVSDSGLTGQLPSYLGTMPALRIFDAHNNVLSGEVPESFKTSGMQELYLFNLFDPPVTGLSGGIDFIAGMVNATIFQLSGNSFTGPVPEGIVNLTGLTNLFIDDNRLVGRLPQGMAALPHFTWFLANGNFLSGQVPPFTRDVELNLTNPGQDSTFCGGPGVRCSTKVNALLDFLAAATYPQEIAMAWVGPDPCTPKPWIGVSCNLITGDIVSIDLRNSSLAGTISPSLAELDSLTALDLSGNALTGPVPHQLASLTNLKTVDVSNNNLSGVLPPFDPSVKVIYTPGNPFLEIIAPATAPATVTSSKKSSIVGPLVGAVVGGMVLCALGFWFLCFYYNRRSRNMKLPAHGSHCSVGQAPGAWSAEFTIEQLREVTEGFAEHNVLGRGGFGVVYKGVLEDGTKIAVKRMEAAVADIKGLNEFQSEIAVLTKVKHRHLVGLVGYCTDGTERLLVYEYMSQGSLAQHLFKVTPGRKPLSWTTRLVIALDVAQAVEYLHSLMHQSFIHRDLKPSNVLLNDDFRAKVADFGLVKLVPEGNSQSMETRIAGTFGYLAPEYAVTGRVTMKADVFSFGVILMELLTGRRAVDMAQAEEDVHLVTWFMKVLRSRSRRDEVFRSAIDPAVIGDTLEDEAMWKSISTVAELAGHCTAREPAQRPDMGHAVSVLRPLVAEWKPTAMDSDVDSSSSRSWDTDAFFARALKPWQESEDDYCITDRTGANHTVMSLPARPRDLTSSFPAFAHSL